MGSVNERTARGLESDLRKDWLFMAVRFTVGSRYGTAPGLETGRRPETVAKNAQFVTVEFTS